MKRSKDLSKFEELIPHLLLATLSPATLLLLLILPAVILDKMAVQLLDPILLVVGEKGTDASLCPASVSGALRQITFYLSARIPKV